jgi:16S rRNA (guanine1207-N2)-methyltransferase
MADYYYTDHPESESNEREITYRLENRELQLWTDRGVFSGSRVDHGSDILIQTVYRLETNPEGLLDLGCGYGPIGLSLGKAWPGCRIVMVDVNHRAMDLAVRNAQANGVSAEVLSSDEFADAMADARFDVVVTNPPIRAGKAVVYSLFRQAYDHLTEGGRLYVVIQKKQGAESAAKELLRLFGQCETVERESGFHILCSVKA